MGRAQTAKHRRFLVAAIAVASVVAFLFGSAAAWATPSSMHRDRIDVVLNDVPYRTEKNLRIGYSLKTWEYEQDGLRLDRITVLDARSGRTLQVLEGAALPFIYRASPPYPQLTSYYLSINLPIPLGQQPPARITHRFAFTNTTTLRPLVLTGGSFRPRLQERPTVLASPLTGRNLLFINHSTSDYHFFTLNFFKRAPYSSERYAVDTLQVNEAMSAWVEGDPAQNESYLNYRAPLHAVADGTIVRLADGRPENHGDLNDAPLPPLTIETLEQYAGNHLILDIGHRRYAIYGHIVPGSFRVRVGDRVEKGDVLASLGNSGNSSAPHLHFQLNDKPEIALSRGLPFVFERCIKVGEFLDVGVPGSTQEPHVYRGRLLEQTSVFDVR